MARKPKANHPDEDGSEALHAAIQEIIDGMGRGGLSYVAERIGMSVSALRKRLSVPGKAFDAPTIRASLLVLEIRSEQAPTPEPAEAPEPAEYTPAPELV